MKKIIKEKQIHSNDGTTIIQGKLFECSKCGECCKHLNFLKNMDDYNRGDGICKYLTSDNLCSIYLTRPNLCRGNFVYEQFFKHMSVDEYYAMLRMYCEKLKNEKLH